MTSPADIDHSNNTVSNLGMLWYVLFSLATKDTGWMCHIFLFTLYWLTPTFSPSWKVKRALLCVYRLFYRILTTMSLVNEVERKLIHLFWIWWGMILTWHMKSSKLQVRQEEIERKNTMISMMIFSILFSFVVNKSCDNIASSAVILISTWTTSLSFTLYCSIFLQIYAILRSRLHLAFVEWLLLR